MVNVDMNVPVPWILWGISKASFEERAVHFKYRENELFEHLHDFGIKIIKLTKAFHQKNELQTKTCQ